MSLTINKLNDDAMLYNWYPGQTNSQPAYINPDCQNGGTLSADWNAEIGNAVPFTVWHGHEQRFGIPNNLPGRAINEIMDKIARLAQRVVDGYESDWNGNNMVAKFDDDATEALEEIGQITESYDESDGMEIYTPEQFYEYNCDVTAETSDDALEQMATDDLESVPANIYIDGDLVDFLKARREEMRAKND